MQNSGTIEVLHGQCPNQNCKSSLYFPKHFDHVECKHCYTYYNRMEISSSESDGADNALNLEDTLWKDVENIVYRSKTDPKNLITTWASEDEKTNFLHKLIAPFLTRYGMEKETKAPILLSDMEIPSEVMDCNRAFGNRTFLLNEEDAVVHLNKFKENHHVSEVLNIYNSEAVKLVPVEVKTGGHGFFHALSVALVGKEIFWHALQTNFLRELKYNRDGYKKNNRMYIDEDSWEALLEECDPDIIPKRNIKPREELMFVMANILRRPIILLGKAAENENPLTRNGSGVFLPLLFTPKQCHKKSLCLAWADENASRFIPLVGIKDKAKLAFNMLPKAWRQGQFKVKDYMAPDKNGEINIGGKPLTENYFKELIECMNKQYCESRGVGVSLVADIYRCHFKTAGMVDIPVDTVTAIVKSAWDDLRIQKCLDCRYIGLVPRYLVPDGKLYQQAVAHSGEIKFEKKYCFVHLGFQGTVDMETQNLMAAKSLCRLLSCPACHKDRMRKVNKDGVAVMLNGDVTSNGKYYWNGKEYDQNPKIIPIGLEWMGKITPDNIEWHYNNTDESLNSTFEGVVEIMKEKHYPDDTDSKLYDRIKHIVKMRLEQQQDLDIPGIEKRKPPVLPPISKTLENLKKRPTSDGESQENSENSDYVDSDEDDDDDDDDDDLYSLRKSKQKPSRTTNPLTSTSSLISISPKSRMVSSGVDNITSPGSPNGTPGTLEGTAVSMALKSAVLLNTSSESGKLKEVGVRGENGDHLGRISLPQTATFQHLLSILERDLKVDTHNLDVRCGVPPKSIRPSSNDKDGPLTMVKNKDTIRLARI